MWTWLYYRNMNIRGMWTLPWGVVSLVGWVLAAVPDARDKGHSRDLQSPLCQRHVTDNKRLYMPPRIDVRGLLVRLYAAELLYETASRVWSSAGLTLSNKRQLLPICLHFDHPKKSHFILPTARPGFRDPTGCQTFWWQKFRRC